jgi:hypothetical protein
MLEGKMEDHRGTPTTRGHPGPGDIVEKSSTHNVRLLSQSTHVCGQRFWWKADSSCLNKTGD